jgi:hypothetical protein
MKTKVSRALVASITFLFASVGVHAGGTIECEFVVYPKQWIIPKNDSPTKLLLAWEVTNTGEKFIRFRIRDLGKIKLVGTNGEELRPTILGVDATRRFQESDYPLIGPHETQYFPFSVSFRRQENGLFSLKIRSNPEGDEGWIYNNLSEGKYSLVAMYSAQKHSVHDGGFMWNQEFVFLKDKYMDNFWVGNVVSKPINIEVIQHSK